MSHEYDIVWIHPTVCTELFGDTSPEKIKKHEKYRSIIKNIHTDYRELIERGRNSAHTKKMQCNIDLYRFAHFDNGIAKRILFQIVNLENNQQHKRIGLLISAYVARSNNTYDRNIVQLLPNSLQKNNLSQEDVVNCIQLLIDDSIRNDNQEVFFTGYANCLTAEISTKETYASNYAPPGSGKSYMIQESLVRYLRNSKIENVDAEHPHIKKISIPRNTIVLVPGPFLLDAYNQYLKSRIAILDTEPPGDFLENFQDPHKQEHAFLIFGNSKWPYTTSITVLQDFLFEKVEKEGIEPRILICTFEQFFKTLAGEEVYTTNPNYLTEMKTKLANLYPDATNTDYTLASGYPDEAIQALLPDKFTSPNNSKKTGRPKKIDSPTPPEESKDIMWTVVQKRQLVVQRLIKTAKDHSITLRSNVAIKAYKTLQTFISEGKQNNNTFKSVQFIIDEHQDLIPNELYTIFGLLAKHPLNEHTSQCKALFFGDNQQRVSNILFSPEILNTIAHHHQLSKIKTLDEVYKYSGSYRIHKQMALFASMFTPRAKSDRNYSSFNFSDIPSYNATDGKHPIEMHYVDDVKTFAQTLLQKSTERVVVFSPYVHLDIDNEHVLYLQDWMALKGLEFARLIYISPILDKDAKNINFDPLENAQLYMAFTRARERILIIQSKKSKNTIQTWLDTNITLKSAELNKNDNLASLIEQPYTIIDDNNIDISNWTDVIDFAQAFQQFKLLWDEWYTGTIDNFDSVHQVFISMLFAEKNIGFPIWKTERLDIVRNYIHKAYPQWQEKITCTHKEDKKFAFVCLLSTENSMWYQYLEYKYPALCERYKKENSDLIQYAEILRHRIDLGYNMSSDVSDKELVEHVFAQWIEAKFAKKDISSEISIFDDEIITSVYTKLQALQKEINQIKEHHV